MKPFGAPVKVLAGMRSGLGAGLADQAVASLGNFGLNVLLARTFAAGEYGIFSIVFSFMLVLNTLHQALITYPLSVRGAAMDKPHFDRLVSVAALLTLMLAPVWIPLAAVAVSSIGRPNVLGIACAALLAWQVQEVSRRACLTRARYGTAIAADVVRYFGAVGVAVLMGPSIGGVFLMLAVCSILASWPIVPTLLRSVTSAARDVRGEIGIQWRLGSALLGANLLLMFSTQWFLWLLAWRHGPAESAVLMALANVAAITNPVLFGAENILVPEIARLRGSMSFNGLAQFLSRRGMVCAAIVAPIFLAIGVFPDVVLRAFYGHASHYAHYATALRLLAAAYASHFVSMVFGAALRGYGAREGVFKMQLYPALLGLSLGSWLTLRFGIEGACAASLLAGLLRAGTGLFFMLRLRELTVRASDAIVVS